MSALPSKADIGRSLYYWLICSLPAKLLLFQGGEVARRHAYVGFDNSFDERIFRQEFVVLSYDRLGLF
jgi:hypothetical protein